MATVNNQATNELLIDLARAKVKQLPWARRYINTTITLVGTAVAMATMVLGLGFDLDPKLVAALVAVVKIGEVIGVKSSKPVPTTAQVASWKTLIPEHVDGSNVCGREC